MSFCVVKVKPNYFVACEEKCIQRLNRNSVKYFFGDDDETPNFEMPLRKKLRIDRKSCCAGILLAEFDIPEDAIEYSLRKAKEETPRVNYIEMNFRELTEDSANKIKQSFVEMDEYFSGKFKFITTENGDRYYESNVRLSCEEVAALKSMNNTKEKDCQFVARLLAIVFGDTVLEMSSAFGTVANNSGVRHKALCTEKRLFVEGIFLCRVKEDKTRAKYFTSYINRKCNAIRKKRRSILKTEHTIDE